VRDFTRESCLLVLLQDQVELPLDILNLRGLTKRPVKFGLLQRRYQSTFCGCPRVEILQGFCLLVLGAGLVELPLYILDLR